MEFISEYLDNKDSSFLKKANLNDYLIFQNKYKW